MWGMRGTCTYKDLEEDKNIPLDLWVHHPYTYLVVVHEQLLYSPQLMPSIILAFQALIYILKAFDSFDLINVQ